MERALVACGLWQSQNGGGCIHPETLDLPETFSIINYGIPFSQLQGLEMGGSIYSGSPPFSIASFNLC